MDSKVISLVVNGQHFEKEVETRHSLGDFLRNDLGLTGTHYACEHGVCGACTVLVDGCSVRSCLMLAVQSDKTTVTTIEGLANEDGSLSELQLAFRECHSLQCGFCTPGMLTTLTELLSENMNPTEAEVRERITGNLCRCTGYQPIIDAALLAASRLQDQHRAAVTAPRS